MKKWKNYIKDLGKRNKILLITAFLLVIFSLLTYSLATSSKEEISSEEEVREEIEIYPLFTGHESSLPNIDVAAAFSLYYSESQGGVDLYSENENNVLPIASISKLMTAKVVFENYNLKDGIGVSESDIITRTEFRDFRAWESTTIEDMLYQMIIESNNSGAYAFALISDRYLKGSETPVEKFVKEMNSSATEIGLTQTKFINPSGLDTREDYNSSTAREVALLSLSILKNHPQIFEISLIPSFNLYSLDKSIHYQAINTNVFLHIIEEEWQDKIVGGKTGFTRSANGCLVIILQSPERDGYIINVVLGSEDRFKEMKKLINFIYTNYDF